MVQPPSGVDPYALFAALTRRGFALRADGGRLLVSPAGALGAEDRAALNESRTPLLTLLADRQEWADVERSFQWRPLWGRAVTRPRPWAEVGEVEPWA
jgi:hypothetical protein